MADIYKDASEASREVRSAGQTGVLGNRPQAQMEPPRQAIAVLNDDPAPEAQEKYVSPILTEYLQGKPEGRGFRPVAGDNYVSPVIQEYLRDVPVKQEPLAQPANQDAGVVSDMGNLLGLGVNNLALSVRELVGRIPGVGQSIVSGLDSIDQWASGKSSEALLKGNIKQGQAALTTETRAAQDKEWWDSDKGTFGEAWSDPRAYMSGVFQSLGSDFFNHYPH